MTERPFWHKTPFILAVLLIALALLSFAPSEAASVLSKRRVTRMPPTLSDVSYGPYAQNVLDFWQAETNAPAPVLIFFHGGGFVSGDKASIKADLLAGCLENSISVVSANYRLLPSAQFPDFMMAY